MRRGIREFSRCQTSSFILLQEIRGFIFPVPAGALPSPSMRERVTGMDWELEQHWGLQHGQSPVSSVLLDGTPEEWAAAPALPGTARCPAGGVCQPQGRVEPQFVWSVRAQGWVCCLFWLN